jgi:peroxiredoxin
MVGESKLLARFAVAMVVVCAGCTGDVSAPVADVAAKVDEAKPQAEVVTERAPAVVAPESVPVEQPQEPIAQAETPKVDEGVEVAEVAGPQRRSVFYRADVAPAEIPAVALSKGHEALCKVKVGDTMLEISLPQLGGEPAKLATLLGEKATVVVFWNSDRRMAREQLADLGPDVVEPFGKAGVAVVGIVVGESESDAQAALKAAEISFANLLDADGKAFAQVGSEKLPRTYLLDPQGKILWFDIEYSLGTRRELHQALRAVAGEPASAN